MATSPITESTINFPLAGLESRKATAPQPLHCDILGEAEFLRLLRRERKRSERSRKPFMLMMLKSSQLFRRDGGTRLLRRIAGVTAATCRETDSLGWYHTDTELGLLFTEIGPPGSGNADLIASKIGAALCDALTADEFSSVEIAFRVFPESENDHDDDDPDLTFYPDFSGRHESRKGHRRLKRATDVIGSAMLIILLSPLMGVVALLVKLTSQGPTLLHQKRVGQHGARFTFLKFRSMYANNDPKIHEEYVARFIAGKGNVEQRDGQSKAVYKLVNDPRVTPLGRFIRKTSLDELPQLFNVLRGEMSLVGPRPPLPYEFERYDLWHRRRVLEVKPGMTGLWQVHGRSKTTFDEMVRLDLQYAKLSSFWLDLKILLQTPKAVLVGDGAR